MCSEPTIHKIKSKKHKELCTYTTSLDSQKLTYPINCLTWTQAQKFCQWIGGKLPSEEEWEFVAKGGDEDQIYPWGNEVSVQCSHAITALGKNPKAGLKSNLRGCGQNRLFPVCTLPKGTTKEGICDLSGSLWEFTRDCYTSQLQKNKPKSCTHYTIRGGGFWSNALQVPASRRSKHKFNVADMDVGFRCITHTKKIQKLDSTSTRKNKK